jgi:CRISPR-associated protein Cas2
MILITTENAPPALRGRLALWLVEIRAGVYVGSYGERVRDMLRKTVEQGIGSGNAMMAWAANTEAGYDLWFHGSNRRQVIDMDGLKLIAYVDDEAATNVLIDRVRHHSDSDP